MKIEKLLGVSASDRLFSNRCTWAFTNIVDYVEKQIPMGAGKDKKFELCFEKDQKWVFTRDEKGRTIIETRHGEPPAFPSFLDKGK